MSDPIRASQSEFSERLVSLDSLPPAHALKLQQELKTMFERRLTLTRRIAFTVVVAFALISSVICGFLAATESGMPALGRVGLGVGTFFGLAWAAVGIRILKRGAIDLKRDNKKIANMAWSFTVLMVVFFLVVGMAIEDRLLGIMMIGQALAFLIGAAVVLVTQRIEQSELATREKLLQIELLVTDLRESRQQS